MKPVVNLLMKKIYMRILKKNILFAMYYVFYAICVSLRSFYLSCLCQAKARDFGSHSQLEFLLAWGLFQL